VTFLRQIKTQRLTYFCLGAACSSLRDWNTESMRSRGFFSIFYIFNAPLSYQSAMVIQACYNETRYSETKAAEVAGIVEFVVVMGLVKVKARTILARRRAASSCNASLF